MRWRRPRPAIGIWSMCLMRTLEVGDIDQRFEQGSVVVAAANPDVLEDYIGKNDMVILGNRYESQLCAIEMSAGCIVIGLGSKVSAHHPKAGLGKRRFHHRHPV